MYRPQQIKDKTRVIDELGNVLFEVDTWIYELAVKNGDLDRWFKK